MAIDWSVISESNFYKDASPEEKEKAERNYFTANFGKDLEGEDYEKSFQEWKNSTSAPKEAAPKSEQTDTDKFIKTAINTMAGPLGFILEGADYLTDGEASKVFNTAGANTVNIVPELANLGIEAVSGKKDVIPTVKVAEPDTEVGKVAAEVLPYLIPVGGTAKGASLVGNTVAGAVKGAIPRTTSKVGAKAKDIAVGAGERFGRNVQQSVLGAAAGNDLSTTEGVGEAVEDTLLGGLIGAGTEKAVEGALKVGSKIIKPGNERRIENAKKIISEEKAQDARIKESEDEIIDMRKNQDAINKLDDDATVSSQFEPVRKSDDDFDGDFTSLYNAPPKNNTILDDELFGEISFGNKAPIEGYVNKKTGDYITADVYDSVYAPLEGFTGKEAKSYISNINPTLNRLKNAVDNSPNIKLSEVANLKGVVNPDMSNLPKELTSRLNEGTLSGKIGSGVSSIGSTFDSGIGSFIRQQANAPKLAKANKNLSDEIKSIREVFSDVGDEAGLKLVDKLDVKGKSIITPEEGAILNQRYREALDIKAERAGDDLFDKTGDSDSAIQLIDRLREDNASKISPMKAYRGARGNQSIYSDLSDTSNSLVSTIRGLGNVGALLSTGGASLPAQITLPIAKEFADRALISDIRRAAGVAVKGDNVRNAISNTLDNAAEVAQTPASLIARPSVINVDDSVIEVDDSEFEQLIGAPESNSKDIIEVDDTEFESLINTPTDGVIEVDEDEFYRMSNPGEAYVGDRLYNGFKAAETGGVKNPWIRTMAQDKSSNLHSSAYGPAQVTYSLAQDYLTRKPNLFTDSEKHYLARFVAQGKDMIAYSQGRHNDKRFAYGAEGILNSDEDKKMYERVVKKMLVDTYRNNGNSIVKTANAWRGLEDPAYNRKVIKNV